MYVQSVVLNGKPLAGPVIHHADVVKGRKPDLHHGRPAIIHTEVTLMRTSQKTVAGIRFALLLLVLSAPGCSSSTPDIWRSGVPIPPPKSYICSHSSVPLTIDGKLDEPDWAHAPWTDDFTDIEGDRRPAPRFRTRAKMLWDDEYFIIGAEISEPHIWGTLVKETRSSSMTMTLKSSSIPTATTTSTTSSRSMRSTPSGTCFFRSRTGIREAPWTAGTSRD